MRPTRVFLPLLLIIAGCSKKDTASGRLEVAGRILDDVTGKPVPGIVVHLVGESKRYGTFGYIGDSPPLQADTTDGDGRYSILLETQQAAAYSVYPVSKGIYARSSPTDGQDYVVPVTGSYTRDIRFFRKAVVKVGLQKITPINGGELVLTGPYETVRMAIQSRDTTIALTLIGNKSITNRITFERGILATVLTNVSAGAGETAYLEMQF